MQTKKEDNAMTKRYLLTAMNISAGHLEYKRVEAQSYEEATLKMQEWQESTIEKHPLVVFKDEKVTEINDEMEVIRFTKTNGYILSDEFMANISAWETALVEAFGNELMIIKHFYYGDKLDMADVILKDGNYMQYNINEKHFHCTGHECTHEQKAKFDSIER
jgi:predicted Ser/Thr protein kinase